MMKKYIFLLAIVVSLLVSCNDSKVAQQEDILVKYGKRSLTREQVRSRIPANVVGVDSVKMAQALIDGWVNMELMTNVAMRNVRDEKRINELVDRYRTNLIVEQYRRNMIMENDSLLRVSEDSLRAYYDVNKSGLKLTSPIVKGRFVKIAADARGADKLKRIFRSKKAVDMDSVESIVAMESIGSDDFRERWTAWEGVETVIPYDFGNANVFLKGNKKYIEFTANGLLYILQISDYMVTNEVMPYEYAKERIREMFVAKNQREYDARLRGMLYDEAVNDGDLEIFYKK